MVDPSNRTGQQPRFAVSGSIPSHFEPAMSGVPSSHLGLGNSFALSSGGGYQQPYYGRSLYDITPIYLH